MLFQIFRTRKKKSKNLYFVFHPKILIQIVNCVSADFSRFDFFFSLNECTETIVCILPFFEGVLVLRMFQNHINVYKKNLYLYYL